MRPLLLGALLASAAFATTARAQDLDPSGEYDVDDVMGRHPHDLSELPTREEAPGRPVTFELSVEGGFASNAGRSHRGAVSAGYARPGFEIDITPVALGGWDVGAGAMIDAFYYAGGQDDELGRGRLEGFVFAERPVGPGTLTAELVLHSVFGNDFGDEDFQLRIVALGYSVQSGALTFEADAEYEDSAVPELRRLRLGAAVTYDLSRPLLGQDLALEGSLAFSDFDGGANRDRNDTVAALALTADRDLGSDWSLGWEAALINRFSNRVAARFTTFDLSVGLAKRF